MESSRSVESASADGLPVQVSLGNREAPPPLAIDVWMSELEQFAHRLDLLSGAVGHVLVLSADSNRLTVAFRDEAAPLFFRQLGHRKAHRKSVEVLPSAALGSIVFEPAADADEFMALAAELGRWIEQAPTTVRRFLPSDWLVAHVDAIRWLAVVHGFDWINVPLFQRRGSRWCPRDNGDVDYIAPPVIRREMWIDDLACLAGSAGTDQPTPDTWYSILDDGVAASRLAIRVLRKLSLSGVVSLDKNQIKILKVLIDKAPMRCMYDDIEGAAGLLRGAISPAIRQLIELGYVERPPGSRNSAIVTMAGRAAVEALSVD